VRLSAARGAKRNDSGRYRDAAQRSAVLKRAAKTNDLLEALH